MILILSVSTDKSTWDVVEWIETMNTEYVVITEKSQVSIVQISPAKSVIIRVDGVEINFNDIRGYWYRRGDFELSTAISVLPEIEEFREFVKRENLIVKQYLHRKLLNVNYRVGSKLTASMNKLDVLYQAVKVGLNVPDTLVTNQKNKVTAFCDLKKSVVTKAISEMFISRTEAYNALSYTSLLHDDFVRSLPETISLSLVQEEIDKWFEVRTFYLKGEFYSMAIFSQENEKTKMDFRNYDNTKPNRTVPFKLPADVKVKLKDLLNRLFLDTGSIDIVVDRSSVYYFLEVNPIGQFGMTSRPCNYHLEREIYNVLCFNK